MHAWAERHLEIPTWDLAETINEPESLDRSFRYLSVYSWSDLFEAKEGQGEAFLPGNGSMYAGVEMINGYSPMHPFGLTQLFEFGTHGFLDGPSGQGVPARDAGPQGLLQLFGVDGLIVSDRLRSFWPKLESAGWVPAALVAQGRVFHRAGSASPRIRSLEQIKTTGERDRVLEALDHRGDGPVPLVLLEAGGPSQPETRTFAPALIELVGKTRRQVEVEVKSLTPEGESLVVFARPWYPGYRASFNGEPVTISLLNLALPAVKLPPGAEGRLVLEYWPDSLARGLRLAGATGAVVLVVLLMALGRWLFQRPPTVSSEAI
jgi:hypothetical protein